MECGVRRWNGWGDGSVQTHLPDTGARHIEQVCGPGVPTRDAALSGLLAWVPAPAVPAHPLLSTDAEHRVRAARGQSLPDWIALRSGQLARVPDAVAFAAD